MAFTPISNTPPQYEENGIAASGYYIKFYVAGTTTPTAMATDFTGGTLLDKCQLNSEGYPINGSSAVFLPHIDKKYKIALFRNEADADSNNLANAAWPVDDLFPFFTDANTGTDFDQIPLNTDIVYPVANVTALRALTGITVGQSFYLEGHTNAGLGAGSLLATKAVTSEIDDNGLLFIADGIVIERIGALSVSFEDFGALEGVESSTAIESAVNSGVKVRNQERVSAYIVSRELLVTVNDIGGKQTKIIFTSASAERGFVFSTTSGLRFKGHVFTTSGTVDQYIDGSTGADIIIEGNTFDHAGCTAAMSSNAGGVHFDNVANVLIRKNIFKNGWRDLGFDAGNVGGNNLFRSVDITNAGEIDVKFIDNEWDTVWSAAYVSNTNVLHFVRNLVSNTADTAFFDRCTSMVTKNKRFTYNKFIDIGKTAIKTLDTNNNNDLVWGEDSIIEGNTVDNWGLYLASECILSARNLSGSYTRSTIKAKGLKILNNEFKQSTAGDTFNVFLLINVDDVVMSGNTIDPIDTATDTQLLSNNCSDFKVTNNTWNLTGRLQLSFEHEGRFLFDGNTVYCNQAPRIDNDTPGIKQRFTFTNNFIDNYEVVPTGNVFGLRAFSFAGTDTFILTAIGNTFKTAIAFQDATGASNYNMIGLPYSASQMIDSNIIEFTDQVATQKMMAGDVLGAVYFRGLPGAARNNGLSAIQYKASTAQAGDVFTLTQT